jgi:ribosomal protein S14
MNPNPSLTNCLFCSAPMSLRADSCPNCKRPQKAIARCHLCAGPFYADEHGMMFSGPMPVFAKQKHIYLHARCVDPLIAQLIHTLSAVQCPDCGYFLPIQKDSATGASSGPGTCTVCGSPLGWWRACDICRLPIYMALQAASTILGDEYGASLVHETCRHTLRLPGVRAKAHKR